MAHIEVSIWKVSMVNNALLQSLPNEQSFMSEKRILPCQDPYETFIQQHLTISRRLTIRFVLKLLLKIIWNSLCQALKTMIA